MTFILDPTLPLEITAIVFDGDTASLKDRQGSWSRQQPDVSFGLAGYGTIPVDEQMYASVLMWKRYDGHCWFECSHSYPSKEEALKAAKSDYEYEFDPPQEISDIHEQEY